MTPTLQPTLDRAAYLDETVWAAERERIFATQWCAVAREEDVPAGGFRRVELAGESVVLVRADQGRLTGFFNVCRHRGAELVSAEAEPCGSLAGGLLRCPYHSWTYDTDGALRRVPFLELATLGVEPAELGLHPVGVATWGGFVFAHLSPDNAEPLATQLGPIPARVVRYPLAELRRGVAFAYDVAANWKVIAENYNECYHCGPIHPELCELVPTFRRGGGGLEWADGIPHRDGAWTFTRSGDSARSPFPDLDESERIRHKGELVYPNLMLSLCAEHVAAYMLWPLGPGHTRVVCDLLFHPDEIAEASFDPSDAADLWDLVNRQDWAIGASVQRGMASRAWTGGWLAPMEDETAAIARWYRALMNPAG